MVTKKQHDDLRALHDSTFDTAKTFERALRELADAADGVDADLQPAVEKAQKLLNDFDGWDK